MYLLDLFPGTGAELWFFVGCCKLNAELWRGGSWVGVVVGFCRGR